MPEKGGNKYPNTECMAHSGWQGRMRLTDVIKGTLAFAMAVCGLFALCLSGNAYSQDSNGSGTSNGSEAKKQYECFLRIDGSHIKKGKATVHLYLSDESSSNSGNSSGAGGTGSSSGTGGGQSNSEKKGIDAVKDVARGLYNDDEDEPFKVLDKAIGDFEDSGFRTFRYLTVSEGIKYDIPITDIGPALAKTRYLGFVMWSYFPVGKESLNVPAIQVACAEKMEDVLSDAEKYKEVAYSIFSGIQAEPASIKGDDGNDGTGKYAVVPLHPGLPPQNVWEQLTPKLPFQPYAMDGYTLVVGAVDLASIYDILPKSTGNSSSGASSNGDNSGGSGGSDNGGNAGTNGGGNGSGGGETEVKSIPGTIMTYLVGAVSEVINQETGEVEMKYEPLVLQGRMKVLLDGQNSVFYLLTGDYNVPLQFSGISFATDVQSQESSFPALSYDITVKARRKGYLGILSLVRDRDSDTYREVELVNPAPISWEDYKCLILCDPKVIFTGSGLLYSPVDNGGDNNGSNGGNGSSGGNNTGN